MHEPRVIDPLSAEWVSVLLFLLFGVLAWVNVLSPRHWRLLGLSLFRFRLGQRTLREEVDPQDRTLVALLLVSVAVIGLFLYQVGHLSFGGISPLRVTGFVGAVLTVVVVQWVLVRSIAELFRVDGGLLEYLYTMLLLTMVLGLVLLPVSMLIAFQPTWRGPLVIAGLVCIALLTVYRWLRGVVIGLGSGSPPGYIILYLCAAEILPAAIALRMLFHLAPRSFQPL